MTDNEYKISVLITYYNQEKYVYDSLKSVLSQKTNFPFKVIIGDDGSNDGTLDKVKEWQCKYPEQISYIVQERENNKKYLGPSRASKNRLALLDKVDTPYFIYLDGDDYWTDNNKLQIQFDALENPQNADCVACAHQIKMFNENSPEKSTLIPDISYKEKKWELKNYWKNSYFHTDTILFRSSVIKDLRRNLVEEFFNDTIITYLFIQKGKILYMPLNMADYRQNNDGIWAGEKLALGIYRNLMDVDLELKINPQLKKQIFERHLGEFVFFSKNHSAFSEVNSAYYELSKKYSLTMAINAYEQKPLFSSSWRKYNFKIFTMRVVRKLKSFFK